MLATGTFLLQTEKLEKNTFVQLPSATAELSTKRLPLALSSKEKQGMTVHFQWESREGECPHLYYTNVNGTQNTNMTSPGVPMKEEGNGWYVYTIPDADSAEIQISVKERGYQTTLQEKSGDDWWFAEGGWYKENPYGTVDTQTQKIEQEDEQEMVQDAAMVAEDSKVTVHCYSAEGEPSLYYWNALPKDLEVDWPGKSMDIVTKDNDFREESIYFVMTTRFYDGDSSNNVHCEHDADVGNGDDDPAWRGDFKGLIEKLDYIKALGFSAVWITPVVENASGYDYHGYLLLKAIRDWPFGQSLIFMINMLYLVGVPPHSTTVKPDRVTGVKVCSLIEIGADNGLYVMRMRIMVSGLPLTDSGIFASISSLVAKRM